MERRKMNPIMSAHVYEDGPTCADCSWLALDERCLLMCQPDDCPGPVRAQGQTMAELGEAALVRERRRERRRDYMRIYRARKRG